MKPESLVASAARFIKSSAFRLRLITMSLVFMK
jgi:hypothetical protein